MQLEKKIEMQHQTHESEQFIDSVEVPIQGADGQTFIQRIKSNVEHPITDLADTLPCICTNATGLAAEAPKPAFPNDASYWHSTGARPKASTPARTWSDIARCRGKSSQKSNKRAPTSAPPPGLSLRNRYETTESNA